MLHESRKNIIRESKVKQEWQAIITISSSNIQQRPSREHKALQSISLLSESEQCQVSPIKDVARPIGNHTKQEDHRKETNSVNSPLSQEYRGSKTKMGSYLWKVMMQVIDDQKVGDNRFLMQGWEIVDQFLTCAQIPCQNKMTKLYFSCIKCLAQVSNAWRKFQTDCVNCQSLWIIFLPTRNRRELAFSDF